MRQSKHQTPTIEHPTSKKESPPLTEAESHVWEFREGARGKRRFDLEERLLEFASAVIDLSEKLPNTRAGNHIAGQMLRADTSFYPNHGEAEDAESRHDFVHKLKI